LLGRIRYNLRIYRKLQILHLRTHIEYEADFWIGIAGMALTHGAGFIFVWTLFSRVPTVVGWSLWEIAFLYALSIIPRGLAEILCDGQWDLRMLVNHGEIDRLLVRPISPVLQLITHDASVHGFGSVILGTMILLRALHELNLSWNALHYIYLVVTLIGSVLLIGAINLATNCIAFWDPATNGPFPLAIFNFLEFTKFPLSIYDRLIQVLITWVVPFAFVSYYPGTTLLGKQDANPWLGYIVPLAGPVVAIVSNLIWHYGLRRYQGTGH